MSGIHRLDPCALHEVGMNESPRARLFAYGVALLAPALTLLVRWPLDVVFGDRVLYMAFIPAILIVAYVGGLWPGLITTVLSALAATYLLVGPFHAFEITAAPNAVALSLLLLIGAIISVLSELMHRARRRVVDIDEHIRSEQALRESEQRWRSLTETLPQLVWTALPDGACDYFSTQWTQHTGVPEDRLLGWQD